MPNVILRNIGCCATMDSSLGKGPLGLLRNAAVVMAVDRIEWVGSQQDLPGRFSKAKSISASGALVTPGLVDCHTHIVFSGSRSDEFFSRLHGKSYEEIAKSGGGIQKTVRTTREASISRLKKETSSRLDQHLGFGVTTVEIKSGYGLTTEDELRLLSVAKTIGHTVDVVPTFLGAHVIPEEFREARNGYITLVTEEMLPRVVEEKLSGICDVFCDEGAFTIEEARKILGKAKQLGMNVKLHADQLKGTGATELAVEFRALSADHLEQISENGISAIAKSKTVAVLIPGSVFFLGKRSYPPARKLIESGVRVAISTDCNPGTSYSENLPLAMTFAAVELRMKTGEIWPAVTVNAAAAIGLSDRGAIKKGQLADLAIWDAEHPSDIPYHYGAAFPTSVIKSGKVVLK